MGNPTREDRCCKECGFNMDLVPAMVERIRGHEEVMRTERRDRDALWCEALAVSLDSEKIEAVWHTFNELRARLEQK